MCTLLFFEHKGASCWGTALQSAWRTHLMCLWDVYWVVGVLAPRYTCSQTKTKSCLFAWETSSTAFSSCLCFLECKSVFSLSSDFAIRSQKRKASFVFVYLHMSVCIYANVCIGMSTYSKAVWVLAGLVALIVCIGSVGGEGGGMSSSLVRRCHGRLVRERWRIKVSLGFFMEA